MTETKTIKDIKEEKETGDNFEWTAEVRETNIPIFEITLPDYVTSFLGLRDGDQVAFSEIQSGDENAMIMKGIGRKC